MFPAKQYIVLTSKSAPANLHLRPIPASLTKFADADALRAPHKYLKPNLE